MLGPKNDSLRQSQIMCSNILLVTLPLQYVELLLPVIKLFNDNQNNYIQSVVYLCYYIHSVYYLQYYIHSVYYLQYYIHSMDYLQYYIHSMDYLNYYMHSVDSLHYYIH